MTVQVKGAFPGFTPPAATHIAREEACAYPQVLSRLDEATLADMGAEMQARRAA